MSRISVAVLRGGPSSAYDDSLKSGAYVLSLLRQMPQEYEPVDIFISREGDWHHAGLVVEPHRALRRAHVVWNALHGDYGEDGRVQQLLHGLKLPFVGSGISSSAFAHNKEFAKKLYRDHGLLTPDFEVLREGFGDEDLVRIFRTYLHPVIVKPATGVRAAGIALAHTFQELKDAVKRTFSLAAQASRSPKVMVEEYVRGTVVTSTVIERAKGEDLYALMPAHVETEIRRARPRLEENKTIEEMARVAHKALGLKHYSSSDFVITPRGKIYILETNSQPVFHEDSLLNQSLAATGWKPREFADHCVKLALNNLD